MYNLTQTETTTTIIPETISEWHCYQACRTDEDCTIFNWNYKKAGSKLIGKYLDIMRELIIILNIHFLYI